MGNERLTVGFGFVSLNVSHLLNGVMVANPGDRPQPL